MEALTKAACAGIAGLFFFASFMAKAEAGDSEISTIRIHTESWEGYTEKSGTGFAWDIIRAVFGHANIRIDASYMPYRRAVRNVVSGTADAWVGSYLGEYPQALYPKWHYDADRLQVIFLKSDTESWEGNKSLSDSRVGWVRGYEYNKYINQNMHSVQLNDRKKALWLLKLDRIDYWIDAAYEIDHIIKNMDENFNTDNFVRKNVSFQKLYLGFSNTERGRYLRAVWDRIFPKLLSSGRIAKIYDDWSFDLWPFERNRSLYDAYIQETLQSG